MNKYEERKYSRSKIEKAGKEIAKGVPFSNLDDDYLRVVDNWRAAHAYPLDRVTTVIQNAFLEKNYKIVQRLKRVDSIIGKLQRADNSGLYRMQDLGGCRVIVPRVSDIDIAVSAIRGALEKNGHIIKWEKNYVQQPREISGYRSHHIIVEYYGNDPYDGMVIEIQVRSEIQHIWATAVEIIDTITHETLKVGTGNKTYMYFFKLVSALFSIIEGTPLVKGVPNKKEDLVREVNRIDKEKKIRERMIAYSKAINIVSQASNIQAECFILITDMRKKTIESRGYRDIGEATNSYLLMEKTEKNAGRDVVLVAAKSFDIIKESYPNYFMDIQAFLRQLNELCLRYPEKPSVILLPKSKEIRILDLFSSQLVERNADKSEYRVSGVGTDGRIVYCPDWPATLDKSYLRYSAITICEEDDTLYNTSQEKCFDDPAVIVARTGASFFVLKDKWKLVTESDLIVLQCKQGVPGEYLFFLIAWLKSNVCMWDLLYNKRRNSMFYCERQQVMPYLEKSEYKKVCALSESIIEDEQNFVKRANEDISEEELDSEIDNFNNRKVPEKLRKIESIFLTYFSVEKEAKSIIDHELELNGYYVYK